MLSLLFCFKAKYWIPAYGIHIIWIILILVLCISFFVAGIWIDEAFWGLLLDGRNKVSLSKLQIVLWTILVISGLIAAVVLNISNGKVEGGPLNITVPSDLWILMGITSVSFVASPIIKKDKQENGLLAANASPIKASFSDLFKGDEKVNAERIDLGKVQMFYLTFIILFAYAFEIGQLLNESSFSTFPEMSNGMVTLLGISNAGYLAYKAAPHVDPEDLRSRTNNAIALTRKGEDLLNRGMEDQAYKAFEDALKSDPKHVEAIIGKARVHKKKGESMKAISAVNSIYNEL